MDFNEKERDEFGRELITVVGGAVKLVARAGTGYIASDIVKKVMPENCGKFGKFARLTAGVYFGFAAKNIVSEAFDADFKNVLELYEMVDGLIKQHRDEKTLKKEDNDQDPKEDSAEPKEEE